MKIADGYFVMEAMTKNKLGWYLMAGTDKYPCLECTNLFFEGSMSDAVDYFKSVLHILSEMGQYPAEPIWVSKKQNQ